MKKRKAETCVWKPMVNYEYVFTTGCRQSWNVCCTGNRVPEKAWYKFCPSCGKNVEVKK